jgi:hypothetical protein
LKSSGRLDSKFATTADREDILTGMKSTPPSFLAGKSHPLLKIGADGCDPQTHEIARALDHRFIARKTNPARPKPSRQNIPAERSAGEPRQRRRDQH